MKEFVIIAITHRTATPEEIGAFHLEGSDHDIRLAELKKATGVDELMYLATCNRVEFLVATQQATDKRFLRRFFNVFDGRTAETGLAQARIFRGEEALRHIFGVASSIDSMVVGEREIITQVRDAYERCRAAGLTGDLVRLVIQRAVLTGKEVYSGTRIAEKPVSVVSLAYRRLKALKVQRDARFIIIGAGQTMTVMSRYLAKHGFGNFAVFNRTAERGQRLAAGIGGTAFHLTELGAYDKGFDVLISCTAATEPIVTENIYRNLTGTDTGRKILIDLAVPHDIDPAIAGKFNVDLTGMNELRTEARRNLADREKELRECEAIIGRNLAEFRTLHRTRQVELAMKNVPEKVREIREAAVSRVFAQEVGKLDSESREVLDKVLAYVEKKYISGPMKMAREIMLEGKTPIL